MNTLQPGGEDGIQAERTIAATGQQSMQDWVVGEHPVDQREPVPVLPQDNSGSQFLGNKGETRILLSKYTHTISLNKHKDIL